MDLRLIGCFQLLVNGRPIQIPAASERVLAYLGVHRGGVARSELAGVLWPGVLRTRSFGNLRSALWRIPRSARPALRERENALLLDPSVRCDLDPVSEAPVDRLDDVIAWAWFGELLAGWYDDWVLAAREAFDTRRARMLERLADACGREGLSRDAVVYATLAVGAQPMQESAHRALLRAHLTQGNRREAIHLYRQLTAMLKRELGVAPSEETMAVMAGIDEAVA